MNKQAENKRSYAFGFSIVGSLLIILLCAFINLSAGSRFPWFIYPAFTVLWWPLAVYYFVYKPRKIV